MHERTLATALEVTRALREHRRILTTLASLEDMLMPDSHVAESGEVLGWVDGACRVLRELRRDLEAHFADEERGGSFDELRARGPELAARVARLHAEHDALLAAVDKAAAQAAHLEPADARQAPRLTAHLRLTIATLRRHEAEENELFQRAVCEAEGLFG